MNKLFIFDYDDTIQMTHHHYIKGEVEFIKWVVERLGQKTPDLQIIIKILTEVNIKNVLEFGFTKERFLYSFVETFGIICKNVGVSPSEKDLWEARRIGEITFSEQAILEEGLVDGAEETFNFLLQKGDILLLMTKGDLKWQARKIELMECRKWFNDRIHIVDHKNEENILKLVGSHPLEKSWLVGNSIRSDVIPALRAGIKTIYIPCETWAYETIHSGLPKDNENLIIFEEIKEIKEKYHLIV